MKKALSGVVEHTTMVASNEPVTKKIALRREPIRLSSHPQKAPARAAATLLHRPSTTMVSAFQCITVAAYTPLNSMSTTNPSL